VDGTRPEDPRRIWAGPVGSPERASTFYEAGNTAAAMTATLTARPLRPVQDIRMAWILLLLDRGPSHGYALARELDAQGLSADSPATYRTLRRLDNDGWVTSIWTPSTAGPRRRSYELTAKGRLVLREMATLIAETRDAHDRFLIVYAPQPPEGAAPSTPSPLPAAGVG
jgi:PadR family transcriptional regulator, regulatory protein PadR